MNNTYDKKQRCVATVGQVVLGSPDDALSQIEHIIDSNPDTNLFVFPEYVSHSDNISLNNIPYLVKNKEAHSNASRWIDRSPRDLDIISIADKYRVAIVFGCLNQNENRLTSRCNFYDPIVDKLDWYDKTHVHWTENFVCAGDSIFTFDTRFGRLGMLICYDTAFSEAARVIGLEQADILCAIAATPIDFEWKYVHRRLSGAAINSQYFVLAAHLGFSNDIPMGGYSAIFGPRGEVLSCVEGSASGSASSILDYDDMYAWREIEKSDEFRRPELYGPLSE